MPLPDLFRCSILHSKHFTRFIYIYIYIKLIEDQNNINTSVDEYQVMLSQPVFFYSVFIEADIAIIRNQKKIPFHAIVENKRDLRLMSTFGCCPRINFTISFGRRSWLMQW